MKTVCTLLLVLAFCSANAQVTPAENAVLNYRLTGFAIPTKASKIIFYVAAGRHNSFDAIKQNLVATAFSDSPRTLITLPSFSQEYTWYAEYTVGKTTHRTAITHFATGNTSFADTNKYRLRILDSTRTHPELLFFSDCQRAMLNMRGEIVWYLPQIPGVLDTSMSVRDMKLTPQGTITFIANTKAYEVDYNGKLLWQAPDDGKVSGDTTEQYHHEFTRLANGNYMAAGNQMVKKYIPATLAERHSDNEHVKKEGDKYYCEVLYGTLIEYNTQKEVVWQWKSVEHLHDSLLLTNAMFANQRIPGFHHNAFYFDEQQNCIYTSFRDINKIIKLAYPSGKVLGIFDVVDEHGNVLLKGQHAPRINSEGNLYLFNNNVEAGKREDKESAASILVTEPLGKDHLRLKWQFNCNIDDQARPNAKGGGNVHELANKDMMACMGTSNRIFIVGRDKKVDWNAVTEYKSENRWYPQSNYRVFPIEDSSALHKLVFRIGH
jgi:hypothetical protein